MNFGFVVVDKEIGFSDIEGFLVLKYYFFQQSNSRLWGRKHVWDEGFFGELSLFRLLFKKVFGLFSFIKLKHVRFTLIFYFNGINSCTIVRIFTEAFGWHLSEIEFGPGYILAFTLQAINTFFLDVVLFEELILDFVYFVHDLVVAHRFILVWSRWTFFVVFLSLIFIFWVKLILKYLFLACD